MIITIICMLFCMTIHAHDETSEFEQALQNLYAQQSNLASAPTASSTSAFISTQNNTPSRTDLNRRAGAIALVYALAKIGFYYYTSKPPRLYHLSYYLPQFMQSAQFCSRVVYTSLEAILLKTSIYYLMLTYYGSLSDAAADLLGSVKSFIF